jgi:hypothetical protein
VKSSFEEKAYAITDSGTVAVVGFTLPISEMIAVRTDCIYVAGVKNLSKTEGSKFKTQALNFSLGVSLSLF